MVNMINTFVLLILIIASVAVIFFLILFLKGKISFKKSIKEKKEALTIPSELQDIEVKSKKQIKIQRKPKPTQKSWGIRKSPVSRDKIKSQIMRIKPKTRAQSQLTQKEIQKNRMILSKKREREKSRALMKLSPKSKTYAPKISPKIPKQTNTETKDGETKIIKLSPRKQPQKGFRKINIKNFTKPKFQTPTENRETKKEEVIVKSKSEFKKIPVMKVGPRRELKVISPFKARGTKTCSNCGKTFPVVASFCPFCGKRTVAKCLNCNAVLLPRSIKCHKCGADIKTTKK